MLLRFLNSPLSFTQQNRAFSLSLPFDRHPHSLACILQTKEVDLDEQVFAALQQLVDFVLSSDEPGHVQVECD